MNLTELRKFGIKFGDNDFYNTFSKLLPAIVEGMYDNIHKSLEKKEITKEFLAELINKTATGFYYAYQNPLIYSNGSNGKVFPVPYNYISNITPDIIFINEELDTFIESCEGWNNSELFCVSIIPDSSKDYGINPYFFAI